MLESELLIKLADNEARLVAAWNVASAVAANFSKLPEKVQNLLFKLADDEDGSIAVAYVVADNFDKLPGNFRNDLRKRLSK